MAYYQKSIGDKTRSSGLMKTKALGKSSMLFNLGKPGSPATMPVACGGLNQPPCAKFDDVLNSIETTGRYSNAQDIGKLDTYSPDELKAAKIDARENINLAMLNRKESRKNLSQKLRENPYGKYNREALGIEGTELNYLQSIVNRDKQIVRNERILRENLNNVIKDEYVDSYLNAKGSDVERKNKKYLEEAYKEYLGKGEEFTSQNDFTAYLKNPKTIGMFQNTTEDQPKQ